MADDGVLVEQLKACPLFHALSKKAMRSLSTCAQPTVHPAGQNVVEEGGVPYGFHLITDGKATVSVHGRPRASLAPGDYFGIVSLLDGNPRSASVTAETDLATIYIAPWSFRPMLKEEPSIAYELLPVLCGMLRSAEQQADLP